MYTYIQYIALFTLGIDNIGKIEIELDLNVWYLEDACFGDGTPDRVLTITNMMAEEFGYQGLQVNTSRCELWILNYLTS